MATVKRKREEDRERCNIILAAIDHITEFQKKPVTFKRLEQECTLSMGQIYYSVKYLEKTNKVMIEKGFGREHQIKKIVQPLLQPATPPASLAGLTPTPEIRVNPPGEPEITITPAPAPDEVTVLRADLEVACYVLEYLRPSAHALDWYNRLKTASVKG